MNMPRVTRPPRIFEPPHRRRRRLAGIACMLLSLLTALKAQADEPVLELGGAGAWQPTLALDSAVDMRIRGLVAEVTVRQSFVNDSGDWLEGRYLLPLPERAAVGRLRIRIGERLIEGEVQEKQAAREIYAAAAANGQRAALVEQDRPNLFRTALSNIGPGEAVEIEIGYWQAVDYRDGEFSLSLPLTFTPRYSPSSGGLETSLDAFDDSVAVPLDGEVGRSEPVDGAIALGDGLAAGVALRIDLQAGLPLAAVSSPTHAIDVRREGDYDGRIIELAELVELADRDFELRWRPLPSSEPQRAMFVEEVDGEHYAMLLLVPPTQAVEALPRELVLVVDTSGSMQGDAMRQAIAALDSALLRLRPTDSFNIVRFSDQAERLFEQSMPADRRHVDEARQWVAGLQASGGTEMAPALRLAFDGTPPLGHVRQVVLATDAAIGNEQGLFAQIEHDAGDARLFAVGIGSAPNAAFIRKAGELGRGSHVLIRDIGEVAGRMDSLFARLDRPVLRDLELQWPQAAEAYPPRVPDLYHGEPLVVVARLPSLHGEFAVTGSGSQRPWQSRLRLERLPRIDATGVGRLWARARIEALEDALRGGASAADIREQIVDVALRHGLGSRYTSLVAVERTPVRPLDEALASRQIANPLPAGQLAMAQGSTGARSRIGMGLALLLMVAAVMRGRPALAGG